MTFPGQTIPFVMATMMGMTLLSCRAPEASSTNGAPTLPMGYEPRGQIDRAPLMPLADNVPHPAPITLDGRDEVAGTLG